MVNKIQTEKILSLTILYVIASIQGVAWNFIPSLSNILVDPKFGLLSSAQYGSLGAVMVIGAIFSCVINLLIGRRIGNHKILSIALLMNISAMFLFSLSVLLGHLSYFCLLIGMVSLGIGLGMNISILNVYVLALTEKYKSSAIIFLYACLGIGSTLIPLVVTLINDSYWGYLSLILGAIFLVLYISVEKNQILKSFHIESESELTMNETLTFWRGFPSYFLVFPIAIIIYGIIEASFWDWGLIYLHNGKNLSIVESDYASSAFWGFATIAELVFTILFLKLSYRWFYVLLPVLMTSAYIYLNEFSTSSLEAILTIGLAGFSCSIFWPLTARIANEIYPKKSIVIISGLLATYFIGTGISSYGIGLVKQYGTIGIDEIFKFLSLLPFSLIWLCIFIILRTRKSTTPS